VSNSPLVPARGPVKETNASTPVAGFGQWTSPTSGQADRGVPTRLPCFARCVRVALRVL